MAGTDTSSQRRQTPEVREAHDAGHHQILKHDPSDEDALLDIALDESFPTSDAPGHTRPGSSGPAPSSGFDEEAEAKIMRQRSRKAIASSVARIGVPLAIGGAVMAGFGLWMFMRPDEDDLQG